MIHTSMLQMLPRHGSKVPRFSCLNSLNTPKPQAENDQVVGEDDETKTTAVNQPHGLEDPIVLLSDDSSAASCISRNGVWVLPGFAFIDLQKLLGNALVMVKGGPDWKARSGNKGTRTL